MLTICLRLPFQLTYLSRCSFAKSKKESTKTYYQVLELKSAASQKEVKEHYLKLAKIYHPDIYKGSDKNRFDLIKQAFDVLSIVQKRKAYDKSIGIGRTDVDEGQGQGKQPQSDSKYQKLNKKPKVKLDYSFSKESLDEDIDEKYRQFFGKRVETPFQEIRIKENHWWALMTQQQRMRKSFETVFNNPKHEIRTMHQAPFKQILNEQIDEANRYEQEVKQAAETYEKKHSPNQINKARKRYYKIFFVVSLITLPIMISVAVRQRLFRDENKIILDKLIEFEEIEQEEKLRQRFRY